MKRNWFARHPIGFMALYFLLYLSAFNFLETQISMPRVLLVHCRLDDLIPFCKYAIVPYFEIGRASCRERVSTFV